MTLHESVHFALNATDPIANAQWEWLTKIPQGLGRIRLGHEHRVFLPVIYHQMHCLHIFHQGLLSIDVSQMGREHVRHCLDYLRQTFLCGAADMLESGDFLERDYEVERVGDTLVCEDWEQAYAALDKNFYEEGKWLHDWN